MSSPKYIHDEICEYGDIYIKTKQIHTSKPCQLDQKTNEKLAVLCHKELQKNYVPPTSTFIYS